MRLVSIIDDSIGAVAFHRLIRDYSNKYEVYIDNLYYPYALRSRSIKKMTLGLLSYSKDADVIISTNPAISLVCRDENINVITGIEKFEENYSSDSLIITNKIFKDYLINKSYNNIKDSSILSNLVVDFNFNKYLIKKIVSEYILDFKVVYMLDSSLYMLKDYLNELFPDVKFIYLTDFIYDEFVEKMELKEGKSKSKIWVSAYRRGVYLSLEEHYSDRYIGIKKLWC